MSKITFDKIVFDPQILGGKPIIKNSRISVSIILEWIASGATVEDIVAEYKHLDVEGVRQAVLYAAYTMKNEVNIEINKVA